MKKSEFNAFRRQLVCYADEHPDLLRKVRETVYGYDVYRVPENSLARKYWRLRGATRDLMRHRQNETEGIMVWLRRSASPDGDYTLSSEEERLATKWMGDFEALKARVQARES